MSHQPAKGIIIGGLLGGVLPLLFFLIGAAGPGKVLAGTIGGAFVVLVFKLSIPRGFPIPKDITTFTCLGFAMVGFSMLADGLLHGEIHNVPRKYGSKGIADISPWSTDPLGFIGNCIWWSLWGAVGVGIPIHFYRKAIRETWRGEPSVVGESVQEGPSTSEKELSEKTQTIIVSIIGICCILVLFYLVILFGSLLKR